MYSMQMGSVLWAVNAMYRPRSFGYDTPLVISDVSMPSLRFLQPLNEKQIINQ